MNTNTTNVLNVTMNNANNALVKQLTWNIPENLKEKYLQGLRKSADISVIKWDIFNKLDVPDKAICEGFQVISSIVDGVWDVIPIPDTTDADFAFLINEVNGNGITTVHATSSDKGKVLNQMIIEVCNEIATSMYEAGHTRAHGIRIVFNRYN